MINVLDHGYVRLVKSMGSDLDVVNDARVSFQKESKEFTDKDAGLLRFLLRRNETSPFRHCMLQFEVYAPLMTARQWWKYVVGSAHQDNFVAWNESSRRYVTEEPTFYVPAVHEWRSTPADKKQGSAEPLHPTAGSLFTDTLEEYVREGTELYNRALRNGVAPEQARLFLPAYGMYVRWRWTASLAGVLWFLTERLKHDAQSEIVAYARAVAELTTTEFPSVMEAWHASQGD